MVLTDRYSTVSADLPEHSSSDTQRPIEQAQAVLSLQKHLHVSPHRLQRL